MCVFEAVSGGLTLAQAMMANAAIATSLVSSVAAPVMSFVAQNQAADAQQAYQQQMYDANKAIAEQSLMSQYADISRRQQEERQKAAQEMQIISTQAQQARSTAAVSAVESGVAGLSVDNLINDYYMKEAQFLDNTQRQLRGTLFQLESVKEGTRAEAQGRILSMTPQPVARPSALATGLQIGGNVASFYSDVFMNGADRDIYRTVGR